MSRTSKPESSIGAFLLDGETEKDFALYVAVGRAVILWGTLAQNFGHAAERLYYDHGGSRLVPEPPFQLKRQIEFWNLCFRKLPDLAPLTKAATNFSREFVAAKKNRDDLLHFAWDMESEIPERVRGRRLTAKKAGHFLETMQLPIGAVVSFAKQVSALNLRLLPLSLFLMPELPKQ